MTNILLRFIKKYTLNASNMFITLQGIDSNIYIARINSRRLILSINISRVNPSARLFLDLLPQAEVLKKFHLASCKELKD